MNRVLIAGAGGRDFHNYLVYFKDNPDYDVVAFTAAQIPGIEKRVFPKELTKSKKKSIPIYSEVHISDVIKKLKIDYVYLCYSDLPHQYVMELASKVLSAGANFGLLGAKDTYVQSQKKVIAVCAVRTGCGKSQVSRAVAELIRKGGKRVVGIRHSMPYGDLTKQTCQRFSSAHDFVKHQTTIEEEEEYQPWIDHGFVIYAGFDYKEIVKNAEQEADILIFDGGNNDIPFIKPDILIVVTDPHRAGDELTYYPGFLNLLLADIVVINKIDSAARNHIEAVKSHIKKYNPKAKIVLARSDLIVDRPELLENKKCAVIGDGPTLTHGGMSFGAGSIAVKKYNGKTVNPKSAAGGSLKKTFLKFPHLQNEIPAMGYSGLQIKELERTVNRIKCDVVVDGTPANLKKIIKINKPLVEVDYEVGKSATLKLKAILKQMKVFK
jgi:predicted GTPase